ncbi:hypothetical protein PV328_008922 [Microctonus aethiopoides]|uniref:Disease resistance R13L4/SHOC-2-like LRR domain-containing protein n=1 Tax=Microctonus aethiopoides TaxID=144406 RepID=A0AA39FKA5_9HYME|nr:hypothetical protein PV328_008922 [Microctonus aethiopoides]
MKSVREDKKKFTNNYSAVFKSRTKNDDDEELSERIIISARKTGQLDLSSKGLSTVPLRVWSINDLTREEINELHLNLEFDNDNKDRWWEQESLKILNLSVNSLTCIDSKIKNLLDLIELDIHDNLIEKLPNELSSLVKLKKLNISHNNLMNINKNLYSLENLRHLNLSYNKLTELNPAIGDLIMLETLNLSYNNMEKLPIGLGYLVRLCSLDLSHNLLIELPPDIMSMRVLKKFDASSNKLEKIPPLGEMRKLEYLNLHDNNITQFPDLIGCTALQELQLSNNNISEIDMECLETMGHLKSLIMANNKLENIPDDIMKMLNMERLDVSFNKLTFVPNFICIMPNLKYFIIDGNDIKNVRRDIIQCGTPRILRHLRQGFDAESIDVKSSIVTSQLNTIQSPDKYVMKHTKLLSLTGQSLQQITDTIFEDASAAGVTCVDLSKNKFSQIPEKLSLIKTVEDLKLSCNQLTSLPNWMGESFARHLRYLDLSKNQLTSMPDSIGLLENLREINISQNRFTLVPDCIYNISHLEILIVHDNQINEIDAKSLAKLSRLATLDLSNNNIRHVPHELGNQTNIRTLLLSGNYFKQPRQATLMKGTEEILSYLRSRLPS